MALEHWLWGNRGLAAGMARCALMPASVAYRMVSGVRVLSYRSGLLVRRTLPAPSVAVGNLTVGGTGKTPIASWIAGYYSHRGITPGVLLRDYGTDEGRLHRSLVPGAVVVEEADRVRGAERAVALGARILVLDDAFQRMDVARDLNVVVVSAESSRGVRWTLPAGPWREPWGALARADLVVVTRKAAALDVVEPLLRRVDAAAPGRPRAVARLGIERFEGMFSGERMEVAKIAGTRSLVAAGVGDPDSFAAQCRAAGAEVKLWRWRDHHSFSTADARRIADEGDAFDQVVVTEKDAVKLRQCWPEGRREPLVAKLQVQWESGAHHLLAALGALRVSAC